jgi:hypothetical protein
MTSPILPTSSYPGAAPVQGDLISNLSSLWNHICYQNRNQQPAITFFTSIRTPRIHLSDYITRIASYTERSNEALIISCIYIDRFSQRNPQFQINAFNIHRLVLTAILLAFKFHDDYLTDNHSIANLGGIPTNELNKLELEFLLCIDFKLFVNRPEYIRYKNQISRFGPLSLAHLHGLQRALQREHPNSTIQQLMYTGSDSRIGI